MRLRPGMCEGYAYTGAQASDPPKRTATRALLLRAGGRGGFHTNTLATATARLARWFSCGCPRASSVCRSEPWSSCDSQGRGSSAGRHPFVQRALWSIAAGSSLRSTWGFSFSHSLLRAPMYSRYAVASTASRGSQPASTFFDSPSCAWREVHLRYAVLWKPTKTHPKAVFLRSSCCGWFVRLGR
jgi:hypothetical protein